MWSTDAVSRHSSRKSTCRVCGLVLPGPCRPSGSMINSRSAGVARARGHGRIESLACSQVWENAWPRTCRFFLFEVTTRYLSPSTIRLDFSILFMRVVRLASSNIPSFTSGVCMFHAHAAPHCGGSTTPPRWQAPPLEPRRRQGSPSMSKSAGWCGKPCRACLRIRRLGTGDSKEAGGFGRIHHSSIAFGPL
jgi:hypothetical protein